MSAPSATPRGFQVSWIGYKLHIDAADASIPVSCILTSASLHDSQVAIPLATMIDARVTNLYDLMDSAYDTSRDQMSTAKRSVILRSSTRIPAVTPLASWHCSP